jgi:hypothetical protein
MVYHLVLCEIFNEKIHGFDSQSDKNINNSYLVIEKIDLLRENEYKYIEDLIDLYNIKYDDILQNYNYYKHPYIRNYKAIIEKEDYIKLEIGECFYLDGGECVVILKTFWLRIIQRKWKKIFQLRRECLEKRKKIENLKYKEYNGKWPYECMLPSFCLFS